MRDNTSQLFMIKNNFLKSEVNCQYCDKLMVGAKNKKTCFSCKRKNNKDKYDKNNNNQYNNIHTLRT